MRLTQAEYLQIEARLAHNRAKSKHYEQPENRPDICPVETGNTKRIKARALDKPRAKRQKGKGRVEVIVTIVTCRTREADDDNNISSCKPLRDAIAASLDIDDGDARIKWVYGQIETRGEQGVIVKIEQA